jgi:transcriptional regulator of acetoin/glycerol metabolism
VISQPELIRALVLGGGPVGAAAVLSCSRVTVWRMARRYNVRVERERVLASPADWARCYHQHGGNVRGMARSLALDVSYIHRQLEAFGIRETAGADIGEDAA